MISAKPWSLDAAIRLGLCIMGTLCAGMLVAMVMDSHKIKMTGDHREFAETVVMSIFFHGNALAWIGFFLRENHLSASEAFGLEKARQPKAVGWGLLATILFLPVAFGLAYLSKQLLQHPESQELVQMLQKNLPTAERAFLGFWAVLVAPVAEEALFRGILYPTLKQLGYPRMAVYATSLAFGAMHLNLQSFVPLVVFSMVLIYLYEKTGSLLASITAHSLFNYINFVGLMLAASSGTPAPVK